MKKFKTKLESHKTVDHFSLSSYSATKLHILKCCTQTYFKLQASWQLKTTFACQSLMQTLFTLLIARIQMLYNEERCVL